MSAPSLFPLSTYLPPKEHYTEDVSLVFFPGDGLFRECGRRVMALVALVFAASGLAVVVAVAVDVEGVVVVVVVVAVPSLAARFFRVFLGVPATGKTIWNVVVGGGRGGLLGSCC